MYILLHGQNCDYVIIETLTLLITGIKKSMKFSSENIFVILEKKNT